MENGYFNKITLNSCSLQVAPLLHRLINIFIYEKNDFLFGKILRMLFILLSFVSLHSTLLAQNCANTTEIGSFTFEDLYTDGIIDAVDNPLANVSVEIFDENGSVGTATSDPMGNYLFIGLTASKQYRVEFTAPLGMEESESNTDFGEFTIIKNTP